jgi:hypothetical protein
VRLVRWYRRVHTTFLREVVPFSCIAGAAGGHHIGPIVVAAAGERDQVIPGQALPVAQIGLPAMTVLAAVAISSKEECVGDLTTEAAGNVDELDESDDCRFGKNQSFASDNVAVIRLDDLGFPLNYQPEGTPHRDHGKRFKGGVQRQTPHATSPNVVNEAVPLPLRVPRIFRTQRASTAASPGPMWANSQRYRIVMSDICRSKGTVRAP